jgi:uncharacterized protein (DUF488 family)
MINTVYTIGYSGFSIDDFVETIKDHNISLVVDIRSSPFSKHFPEYNKGSLEIYLKKNNIFYCNYAVEFGARQNDRKYYCNEGYLDFEVFSKSEQFLQGINKLCNRMEQNYTFVLLCAEKDPICCHRTILVARAFFERGYNVVHLLTNGKTITQQEVNTRLLEKYYPTRDQISLFESIQDDDTLLKAAYKKQNAEIGYRLEE